MLYFVSFLEGIITFISPCLLPMLPIYISYFAGGGERKPARTLLAALGFVSGFTIVFMAMGALAGAWGSFFAAHSTAVNLITGGIVVIFGLNYMGLFDIPLFRGSTRRLQSRDIGFFSALLLGLAFSIGWTPCVGVFLGSALMLASQQGQMLTGMLMLLSYSLGLGIPFVISALLIDQLKSTFDFIKRHYRAVNLICGGLLVALGLLMMSGRLGLLLARLG
ncbi:MAG: cytochrome c biogenesis protein CcdA [Firmicutes bacterium]|nr:cytochrome c biogenesis protein CcdA [Bacillota bacterium]